MAEDYFGDVTEPQDFFEDVKEPALAPGAQPVPPSLAPPVRFVPQGVPRETPREEPGFWEGAGAGYQGALAGGVETAYSLYDRLRGAPPRERTETVEGAEQLEKMPLAEGVTSPGWWGYTLGRGAPAMAAYTTGAGVLSSMAASGLTQFMTEYGPAFRANLARMLGRSAEG